MPQEASDSDSEYQTAPEWEEDVSSIPVPKPQLYHSLMHIYKLLDESRALLNLARQCTERLKTFHECAQDYYGDVIRTGELTFEDKEYLVEHVYHMVKLCHLSDEVLTHSNEKLIDAAKNVQLEATFLLPPKVLKVTDVTEDYQDDSD